MLKLNDSRFDLLSNPMVVDLDVLCVSVKNGIVGQINCAQVFTVENKRWAGGCDEKGGQERVQPD